MEDNINFALLALKTEQFATFEDEFTENEKLNLATELEFKIEINKKLFIVFATFIFNQDQKTLIKLRISCHFKIASKSWKALCDESKILFPKDFVAHMAMLTVGSGRGVLHAKTEGSNLNRFLLPTINVTSFIDQDLEFSI